MPSEEELQRQVEAQARRVQAASDLPAEGSLVTTEVDTEQELKLAKEQLAQIRKYTDDTTD